MRLTNFFKPEPWLNIAYAEGENDICCAVDAHIGIPEVLWLEKPKTNQQLFEHSETISNNYRVIRPIPYQSIWRKVIYVPEHYTEKQIGIQAIATIKENLPVDLKEIFCDYDIQPAPEKKAHKVSLFATRRDLSEKYAITPDTVLDCELHCFFRGYHHLNRGASTDFENNRYYCRGVEFQFSPSGIEITPKDKPSEGCLTVADITFPDVFEIKDKEAFVLAMGAVIWTEPQ